ncbi:hypothetical protein CUZ56_01377 [Saezia sanguinis]|uniref:Uncharacterized protein n=1 Tax=Saezia sanguinis TaxID=1965230 RepID=A0A433SFD2_9BURK|nr:hypothetical protein [Saezia sanguinis]RUS67432.1 hypothetical protein CUZ56_01377 [Saezia sanguinis]
MNPLLQHKTLYRIDECIDLMLDSCVIDHNANLVFASAWGSDTATQSLLAKLTLGNTKDGMDHFHMINENNASIPVYVGDLNKYEKRLARFNRCSIFGSIVNVWIYDKRCKFPDEEKSSAYMLYIQNHLNDERLWALIKATCSIPLLDEWQKIVIEIMQDTDMLIHLPTPLGPLAGYQLQVDLDKLTSVIGEHIRHGMLSIPESYKPQAFLTAA